jgi:hypothetical protein
MVPQFSDYAFQPQIRSTTPPSFDTQGISVLGAASLDAAHCDHETPCTTKHGSDFLALYFGSRVQPFINQRIFGGSNPAARTMFSMTGGRELLQNTISSSKIPGSLSI